MLEAVVVEDESIHLGNVNNHEREKDGIIQGLCHKQSSLW